MSECAFCSSEAVTFALVSVDRGRPVVAAVCWPHADKHAVIPREKVPS